MILMKKSLLLSAAIFCMAISSFATVHTVTVADFSFTPSSFSAHVGDTVMWTWSGGTHTTTSETIPAGAASWNSNMTSVATSFMYVPTVVGTYNYECTIHVSMGMTGSFTVTPATGVNEMSAASMISVFPNPASNSVHLQFNATGLPITVTLTDMSGKQVIRKRYKALNNTDLDLQDIPNGTYILHAKQGSDTYNQQLVVSH